MKTPFISLLIPIRNERHSIDACLQAITTQTYPRDHVEILIADGLSTDGTYERIQEWSKNDERIFVWQNTGKIAPVALNSLIRKAKGEVLIRVDGHTIVAPDYFSCCIRHLQQDGVDGVGGVVKTIGEDFTSDIIALAMSTGFGVGNSAFRLENVTTKLADTIPFPAYTREIVEKVGLFDEELVRDQDDEYNYRIRKAGGKLLISVDIHSTYYSRNSFSKLWKQYYQYGFWKVRVLQKHPKQMSLRQFVPPLFMLSLFCSLILALITSWGWMVLTTLLGAYLVTNLLASFRSASGKGLLTSMMLFLAYAIIHVSYGLGFLVGLVRFAGRWGDKIGKVPQETLA